MPGSVVRQQNGKETGRITIIQNGVDTLTTGTTGARTHPEVRAGAVSLFGLIACAGLLVAARTKGLPVPASGVATLGDAVVGNKTMHAGIASLDTDE